MGVIRLKTFPSPLRQLNCKTHQERDGIVNKCLGEDDNSEETTLSWTKQLFVWCPFHHLKHWFTTSQPYSECGVRSIHKVQCRCSLWPLQMRHHSQTRNHHNLKGERLVCFASLLLLCSKILRKSCLAHRSPSLPDYLGDQYSHPTIPLLQNPTAQPRHFANSITHNVGQTLMVDYCSHYQPTILVHMQLSNSK